MKTKRVNCFLKHGVYTQVTDQRN